MRGSDATARRSMGLLAFAGLIACIVLANWAVSVFGAVYVAPGLRAPAAVYFIGVAFTCRDLVQNLLGRAWSLSAIITAALLSALLSPAIALASGLAAGLGELTDFCVYTPLLSRGWLRALVPANLAGLVVDSLVFLSLAFGSLQFLPGQIVGKAWMTLLAVSILLPVRHRYVLRPEPSAS